MATATQETHSAPVKVKRVPSETAAEPKRYVSLDAYRGFIMLILASEGFGFPALRGDPTWSGIAHWFRHVPWEGGVFWDMIQPAFMLIVGLAMPFALARRKELTATEGDNFRHVLVRSLHLIILSQIIIWVESGAIKLQLINVLSQIAFTYTLTYFLLKFRGSGRYIIPPLKMRMLNSFGQMFCANSVRYEQRLACVFASLLLVALPGRTQNQPVRVIAFGAHPDDCDLGAGGVAAKFAALGNKVKFVSLTNGDAGHQLMGGQALAKRRRREAQEAGRRIGIEYEVLNNHDGKLLPTLEVREQVIREIRKWNADIVIAPRPNDYHPDHRYTGVLVQDASYMVIVPDLVTDTPPLKRNPVFLYYSDRFTRPQPFRADIVVSIDDVFEKKVNMLDAHVSQFYEWLPWTQGQFEQVPKDPAERKKWLEVGPLASRKLQSEWREALQKRYGAQADRVQHAEAFEITEYGYQPSEEEIRKLFPFFPDR